MKQRILSANQIKVIAIISMTIDHIAFAIVPHNTTMYFLMRCIGRLTAPLMSFLLVEGFCHTRSRKKYFLRLFAFAVISQPFYYFFVFNKEPKNLIHCLLNMNVMFTLAVALSCLAVLKSKLSVIKKVFLFSFVISLSQFGDWSYMMPIWTIIFFFFRKCSTKKMFIIYTLVSIAILPMLFLKPSDNLLLFSYNYGVLLAMIPIAMYNGKREKNIRTPLKKTINQYFFYAYYPLHMIIITLVTCI